MPQLNKHSKLNHSSNLSEAKQGARPKHTKRGKKTHRSNVQQDPTEGLMVANPNAAAIDVGSSEHWVAVPPGRAEPNFRKFGCCTADLEALVDWLVECKVDTVVLEATGNYWVVLYDLLEARSLRPVLVNPRYAKNMSGKKGDIPDCQWMQKLHTYGLFANSFRPTEPMRVLRAYLRQRETLVAQASQSIQHMQKALTEMNVQLTNVISDVSGETGLRIIDAILSGERNPKQLARLKDPRIRASCSELARALEGHWKDEQIFVLEQSRLTYLHHQEQIAACEESVQQHMRALEARLPEGPAAEGKTGPQTEAAPVVAGQPRPKSAEAQPKVEAFNLSAELRRIVGVDLTAIDGIGPVTAQVVLSEIGVDMSYWPSEKQFASWLGLCPDHRISGGRILGRSTRPVVNRARHALRLAAYTLERSKSWLGAKYRRLKYKLGAPKAIVAMAHHLARLMYRMIKNGEEYLDKGMEVYEAKYREQRVKWLEKQAKDLNLKVVAA
jgi:transposase